MLILAYIDPSSWSMAFQVLLASALAIPFFFRRSIGEIWHRIRGNKGPTAPAEGGEDSDSGS
jgi:hypothetical protein